MVRLYSLIRILRRVVPSEKKKTKLEKDGEKSLCVHNAQEKYICQLCAGNGEKCTDVHII